MATKKHNAVVIGLAAAIAIAVSFIQWQNHDPHLISKKVYKVANGWGYDILVNNKLLIRQESVPVIPAQQPFATERQAEKTAELVIQKLKAGQAPVLTTFDLEKILPAYTFKNGR